MDLARISRIPKRLKDDFKIFRLAKNWREILWAKLNRKAINKVELRNGVVLNSPEEVALEFLFHEIWIDEFYAPAGYEIKANHNVIDIGANIGVFALWAATRAPGVKVWSCEPFPQNAAYFETNKRESKVDNIEFYPVAVADLEGKRILHVDDRWILHSLTDKNSDENGLEVDCVSVDRLLSDIDRCDLMKLDCEGGEYEILYAASPESLRKIRRLVCEFNEFDKDKRNGRALGEFLIAAGFTVEGFNMLGRDCGFLCASRTH
jgi:FkbM family methyltransferase